MVYLPGRAEENNETSKYGVLKPRLEPGKSQTLIRSVSHHTATFGNNSYIGGGSRLG